MLTSISLPSLTQKKKKTSTAYNDHTAPSCPRQTNPGSSASQNWFLQMCFKKIKHIWCTVEQHREFVWGVCKKRKPPAFTHFCFFVPSLMSLGRYICKFSAPATCENQITTANVQAHTHTPPHIATLRVPSVYGIKRRHLQHDKNTNCVDCYWAAFLSGGCVSPWVCFAGVSSDPGEPCGPTLQEQTRNVFWSSSTIAFSSSSSSAPSWKSHLGSIETHNVSCLNSNKQLPGLNELTCGIEQWSLNVSPICYL